MHNTQEELPLQESTVKPVEEAKNPKKTFNYKLYLVAAIANLLAFASGFLLSWASPVIPKLIDTNITDNPLGRPITKWEESWLASLISLGGLFGPLASGRVADKIGRKKLLLTVGVLEAFAMLIFVIFNTIGWYFLSRFLSGLCLGGVFNVLPMYLVEISETHNRGTLGCSMNIFLTSGLNFALITGPYLPIRHFALVCTLPLLFFLPLFFFLCPETPAYLARVSDNRKIEASLKKVRRKTEEEVHVEANNLLESSKSKRNQLKFLDLFKNKGLRKSLMVTLSLITLQQSVGYSAIISYMQIIFSAAKNHLPAEICVMIVGSFQVCGTTTSTIVVDKAGRKALLLGSAFGTGTTLASLTFYFYLKKNEYQVDGIAWLPILSLVIYVLTFSVGLGPVPWVVMAEVFPLDVRATAAAITSFTCFVVSFSVTITFPLLASAIGMEKCFFIFAFVAFVGAIFIYLVVPETKGKSLDEIQKMLN